ncbi:MAG: serine/threonine protein kinase [Actinomycetota bacterium]|nr:serine/threonine protein kinase [Actinomycetota bacterium]
MTAPSSPSSALLAARYRLGTTLGSGGMATVYEALDERLERTVAVKILRPDMAARVDVRARFEAEARSAARLTHPNVVAVFDTGEDDGVPFIVMEKLPGETLGDRMAASADEVADSNWVLRVAGDVLGALGAAHAAGTVHRDVKPGNILMAGDGCAKVADFGIAKSLEVAEAADLTSTNQLIGTPAYVAPERILGEPATVRSDLYAMGVVLYEALSGRKPFAGTTPVATAYAIRHETPPALGTLRPDLPAHVVAAVERAMDREPARRFATAAEMAEALGVDVAGVPTSFLAPDADATVTAPAMSSTQVLPVAAAAVLPLAAPTTTPAPAPVSASASALALLHDGRRLRLVAIAGLVLALVLFGLAAAARGGDGDDPSGGVTSTTAPTVETSTPTTAAPPTTVATPPPPAPVADPDSGRGKGKGKDDDD